MAMMKKGIIASIILIFLSACQKDILTSQSPDNESKKNVTDLDIPRFDKANFMLPDRHNFGTFDRDNAYERPSFDSLDKICNMVLKQDSQYHFLDTFLYHNGYPDWYMSFFVKDISSEKQILSIPFLKNGKISGVLQYHTSLQDNGLIYYSEYAINHLVDQVISPQNGLELNGILL